MAVGAKSAFSTLLGSSIVAQVILVACSMIFARVYSADAFGMLAQITGLASIVTVVVGLRFDHMAFSKSDDQKTQLYGAAFLVLAALSLAMLLASTLAILVGAKNRSELLWLALFAIANGSYYLCSQWQIARRDYKAFGRVRIIQACAQLAIGISLYVVLPANGMLLAVIASQGIVAFIIWRDSSSRPIKVWGAHTFACIRANFRVAATNSTSALLQYSTPFAPVVIGPLFFPAGEVGAYFLFSSAIAAPCAILRRSILSYFNGEMNSPGRVMSFLTLAVRQYWTILLACLAAVLFALTLLQLHHEIIVKIVFGNKWQLYSSLVVPLVLFFAFDTVLQPFSTFLGMWGREGAQIYIEVLRFMLTFGAWPLIVYTQGMGFMGAIVTYLALMLSVYILNFAIVLRTKVDSDLALS